MTAKPSNSSGAFITKTGLLNCCFLSTNDGIIPGHMKHAGLSKPQFILAKLVMLCFVGFSLCSHALRHDLQAWTGFYFLGPTESASNLYLEVQPRFGSNLARLSHILVRTAFVYNLDTQSGLWVGHGWTPSFENGFKDEQRLWQQYQYKDNWRGHPC